MRHNKIFNRTIQAIFAFDTIIKKIAPKSGQFSLQLF